MDPLSTNLASMFTDLLLDALNEYTYAAEIAGISYDVYSTKYGFKVIFEICFTWNRLR